MRITDNYVFFYKDWLSNYQKTKFYPNKDIWPYTDTNHSYFTSTEQAFMYEKAMFFGDYEIANLILNNDNPAECRRLGRHVHNYDDKKWESVRYGIFYKYNFLKYTQDKKLQKMLLDPKFDNKIFVEASPIDRIWGIGIGEDVDNIEDLEYKWGRNLLGKIITNIRNRIKQNKVYDSNWNIYDYWGHNDATDK